MNIVDILDEHNIAYNVRGDWYNVCCPFCLHDTGYHLGISNKGYATCFKCGWHSMQTVLAALLDCGYDHARSLARRLYSNEAYMPVQYATNDFKLPSSGKLSGVAFEYFSDRMGAYYTTEDLNALVDSYDLRYTAYDYPDYMYAGRIVFPNKLNGKAVSYQCRDYMGIHNTKYITAGKDQELVFHKNFLWGIDHVPYNKVIVCEGVMDALTIGAGAVHTHGVRWTTSQAAELMCFDEVYICYDSDSAGMLGARDLARNICHRAKVKVVRISAKDVNSCSKSEVEDLRALIN